MAGYVKNTAQVCLFFMFIDSGIFQSILYRSKKDTSPSCSLSIAKEVKIIFGTIMYYSFCERIFYNLFWKSKNLKFKANVCLANSNSLKKRFFFACF